jgi:ribosomal protein L37AE/L43A
MRTNGIGQRGKYECDRCHKPASRGVYTGVRGFCHVCPACVVETALAMGARLGKEPKKNVDRAQHYILRHQ